MDSGLKHTVQQTNLFWGELKMPKLSVMVQFNGLSSISLFIINGSPYNLCLIKTEDREDGNKQLVRRMESEEFLNTIHYHQC